MTLDMDDLLNMLGDACKIDTPSKQEGRQIFMVISPNVEK